MVIAGEGMSSLNVTRKTPFCSWPTLLAALKQPDKAVKQRLSANGGILPEQSFHYFISTANIHITDT